MSAKVRLYKQDHVMAYIGLTDGLGIDPGNGIGFYLYGMAGAQWWAKCRKSAVTTEVGTNRYNHKDWMVFGFVVTPDRVAFAIEDEIVAVITTNIPTVDMRPAIYFKR